MRICSVEAKVKYPKIPIIKYVIAVMIRLLLITFLILLSFEYCNSYKLFSFSVQEKFSRTLKISKAFGWQANAKIAVAKVFVNPLGTISLVAWKFVERSFQTKDS